ncbi:MULTISPECIES: glycosyl hydrolase family 28 protein [Lonsdalea]|uniref:Exo-poly-alpha-D-galacturonosidase n=2 Tax=Lonsdalea TaxID=1082702 RepID=A0ACD1JED4_9GAMM|nr:MULTISPECIES: glycoside hydrolase family 28 protein [Lonsdalea]RAT15145.1 exo-poly-alpha-D-galacturonosidase [Lonsdalea quercina]RAT20266.1 exo-poly-alpha-D-galacturonosidase [Lonsdalea populi]RAT25089.1 exo-poly-alpha-D-galacturonosidase [Lonsdalea populi]RAT26417.1 exo-poly-alpha-D-galacturonosidase [Lonsdalea populi]RAT32218.1 exo-poly-alpha-D-galacturonosidase [Lonsdalea populi]
MKRFSLPGRYSLSAAAALLLFTCASSGADNLPQQLRVPTLAYDDHSVVLVWDAPEDTSNIVDYQIYQDGKPIGLASKNNAASSPASRYISTFYKNDTANFQHRIVIHNARIDNLKANTQYQFTVRVVYADGTVSGDSNTVTAKTASVPQVLDITQYGAKGDGATLNTAAIQKAINACKPGCRVDVPAGVFKTGALWLKSDMTLNLVKGATLLGSDNPSDYPEGYKLYPYSTFTRPASLINAIDKNSSTPGTFKNIRIVGQGIIDGNGWKRTAGGTVTDEANVRLPQYVASNSSKVSQDGILAKNQVDKLVNNGVGVKLAYGQGRSSLITLRGVENVYLADFTVRNPAYHGIMLLENHNAVVNGLTHQTYDANNADGVEFGNSQNVMAFNNVFDTGDDCINFAAGTGANAGQHESMKGAWLFNNYFRMGHGAIVTGSHTGAWIQDIVAENNVMQKTDVGLRAKSAPSIGGGAHNVVFRNNAMKDIVKQAVVVTLSYSDSNATVDYPAAKTPARFYDFAVSNVTVQGTSGAYPSIEIVGDSAKGIWHSQLNFNNVTLDGVSPASIDDIQDSTFNQVSFTNLLSGTTPWKIGTVKNVTLDGKKLTQ